MEKKTKCVEVSILSGTNVDVLPHFPRPGFELEPGEGELELTRIRLMQCGVAAASNTPETIRGCSDDVGGLAAADLTTTIVRLRTTLKDVWAAIGDRLGGDGPLDPKYASGIARKVREAIEGTEESRCPRCHQIPPNMNGCAACHPERLGVRLAEALREIACLRALGWPGRDGPLFSHRQLIERGDVEACKAAGEECKSYLERLEKERESALADVEAIQIARDRFRSAYEEALGQLSEARERIGKLESAAAPELLEAAERLLEHFSDVFPATLIEEFRAAVAKAKGAKP